MKNFKTFFLFLPFVFISTLVYSQQYQWANGIGGSENDIGGGIAVDKNLNVYTVGTFRGTNVDFDPGAGTLLLSSNGSEDTYFAKYDSSGNCLWAKSMGGSNSDIGLKILVDETGNIYLGGWFGSAQVDFDPGPGTYLLSAETDPNLWFAKYDTDGNFIWAFRTGGAWMAGIHDICFDNNGFILATGYFCGTNVNFNPKADPVLLNSAGNSGDIFFAKYDTSGICIFAKSCSGPSYEVGNTISTDFSDNIYLFGPFQSTVDFDPGAGTASLTSAGSYDIFFAKYTPSGEYIWAKRIGGTGMENSGGLTIDDKGTIYLSGSFTGVNIDFDPGSGTTLLNSNGGTDIFLAKYDDNVNCIWAGSIGGSGNDNPLSLFLDSENNIYQAGSFSGQNVDFDLKAGTCLLSSVGGSDIFFSRYNQFGKLIWAHAIGGSGDDVSWRAIAGKRGYVYVIGSFTGLNIDFDPGTGSALLNSNGAGDIFFAKYSKEVLNPYFGFTVPDTVAKRFGTAELISNGIWWWHGAPVFSPDGSEMFVVKYIDLSEKMELFEMDNINGQWSTLFRPAFVSDSSDNCPFFLQDGNRLMFMSNRSGLWRLYYVDRTDTGWSEVQPVNFDYNSLSGPMGITFSLASDSFMYFFMWSQQNSLQINKAHLINGVYTQFEELPEPVNSSYSEGTAFIAPDQSYLLFDSDKPGLGLHDIYLSFKKPNGSWTPPANLGNRINGSHEDAFPNVSPDGKFIFFTSAKPGDMGYNAYWVSTEVINKLNPLVAAENVSNIPDHSFLHQNYPNPFNPVTTIKYSLPRVGRVKITLYNILGREVACLVNEEKPAGTYEINWNANNVPSGIYFYQLQAGDFVQTKKMILMK